VERLDLQAWIGLEFTGVLSRVCIRAVSPGSVNSLGASESDSLLCILSFPFRFVVTEGEPH